MQVRVSGMQSENSVRLSENTAMTFNMMLQRGLVRKLEGINPINHQTNNSIYTYHW